MRPAGADPFPREIEIVRGRRRTIELRLDHGSLLARVPQRISRRELDEILPGLRDQLWSELSRKRVFDEEALLRCARHVARKRLSDLELPPYQVRFSRRQNRRWGSCTIDPSVPEGRIRVSDRLRGHPRWLLEHLLLHELIHLVVPDHGARFQDLMARCPHGERAEGYLEALEGLALLGTDLPSGEALLGRLSVGVIVEPGNEKGEIPRAVMHGLEDLPLFSPVEPLHGPHGDLEAST